MILLALKFFSQFVSRQALRDFFTYSSGVHYEAVKEELRDMSDQVRIPGLDALVFGVNHEAIRQRISTISGHYLFVEYGNINSSVDRVNVKRDSLKLSVTVAAAHSQDEDQLGESILQQDSLDALNRILAYIRDFDDIANNVEWVQFPYSVSPFVAKELSNSFGFTAEIIIQQIK